eukprot:3260665-Rhodomonas_salina.1
MPGTDIAYGDNRPLLGSKRVKEKERYTPTRSIVPVPTRSILQRRSIIQACLRQTRSMAVAYCDLRARAPALLQPDHDRAIQASETETQRHRETETETERQRQRQRDRDRDRDRDRGRHRVTVWDRGREERGERRGERREERGER